MKRVAAAVAFALAMHGGVARAGDTVTHVADGVDMTTRTTATPEIIHVLKVDLTTPGVHLGSTTSAQRQRTTSSFAKLVGAAAAVNGDFFSYATYGTSGLAAGGGAKWTDTHDTTSAANLVFDDAQRVEVHDASQLLTFDPTWMKGVVSGHPQLINGGVAMTSNGTDPLCTTRNPRTAGGLTQDGKTVVLAVVDGRSSSSLGMTCVELAATMKSFGAYDAFNFDGGGSSTMYLRGTGVVNHPSDGSERVVGNHLGVYAPRLGSVGTVHGTVYEDPDPKHPLSGASVTIAHGGTDTTDAAGLYELDTLPGTFAVTAKKPGYTVKSMTVTVGTGANVKLDVALVKDPNADFDGDGVPDAKDDCPEVKNPDQSDLDHDGLGDLCDLDDDGDGVADEDDDCPAVADPQQTGCPAGAIGGDAGTATGGPPAAGADPLAGPGDEGGGGGCNVASRSPASLGYLILALFVSSAFRRRAASRRTGRR